LAEHVRVVRTKFHACGLLTDKEWEVLQGLSSGLPNRQIAARMGISVGTVKTHLHRFYEGTPGGDRVPEAGGTVNPDWRHATWILTN